jgi:signal transduction histidine kinase
MTKLRSRKPAAGLGRKPGREQDLAMASLRESVRSLKRAELLQRALFAISDMAGSDLDMPAMLRGLHEIVGSLMYAENFLIVRYDPELDSVRFIYYADVADMAKPDPDTEVPMSALLHSLTWYMIREGRALMGAADELRQQVPGPLQIRGPESHDCLGVSMLGGGSVRGAVIVQSYVDRPRYTVDDQALLAFVASHILTALERKQAHTELERRVEQRTAELARTNAALTAEVLERERGARLQTALFCIAELSSTTSGMQEFYAATHAIVGGLINATNFYIALLSDDRTALHFPYWVDERERGFEPRALRQGGTEYVIRSGQPALLDTAEIARLETAGDLCSFGTSVHCWLGVPLICSGTVVGVVAVQSYTPELSYSVRDQELLTFVSYQMASSLQRLRAAEALKNMNVELEQRVTLRTQELREQITVREGIELVLKQRNTDLQATNQKLAGTQSQLLQSEKMASVGQLAAGVAHEINNPIGFVRSNLTSLKGYMRDVFGLLNAYEESVERSLAADDASVLRIRALKASIDLDHLCSDIPALLAESLGGISRVAAIVKDLKDFSHVNEAEWQESDLHQGLESTLNVAAHELKYKAEVVKEYGQLPLIECLPFQLNQVFLNLLVNAAQAIEQRGTITIRTGSDDGEIWLQFSDTGRGIAPENLKRIFEPFFTTKPVGMGTGLGLSVSYGIIEKHGGSIEATSQVNQGTTFTIRLPIKARKLHPLQDQLRRNEFPRMPARSRLGE